MTKREKFVADLANESNKYRNDPRKAQKLIQSSLTIALDESYANTICNRLFQLPEYNQILELCKTLRYRVWRSSEGKHRLHYCTGASYVRR